MLTISVLYNLFKDSGIRFLLFFFFKNKLVRFGLIDGSSVKSTCDFWRRPGLGSQHQHHGDGPREVNILFWPPKEVHACDAIHKNKINIEQSLTKGFVVIL